MEATIAGARGDGALTQPWLFLVGLSMVDPDDRPPMVHLIFQNVRAAKLPVPVDRAQLLEALKAAVAQRMAFVMAAMAWLREAAPPGAQGAAAPGGPPTPAAATAAPAAATPPSVSPAIPAARVQETAAVEPRVDTEAAEAERRKRAEQRRRERVGPRWMSPDRSSGALTLLRRCCVPVRCAQAAEEAARAEIKAKIEADRRERYAGLILSAP